MPQLVIVADDLTGAADTGACFASAELATVIPLSGTTIPDADVVALSTDSRDLSASDVASGITRLAASGALARASERLAEEGVEEAIVGAGELEAAAVLTDVEKAERAQAAGEAMVGAAAIGVAAGS